MNTAVVTGAGRGLGRLIAQGLSRKGLSVLVTDIAADSAAQTAELCGNGAWSMTQDVRDPASHRAVADAARQRGDLAIWVNNAGVLGAAAVWEQTEADIERHVDVNFNGVIWGTRAAIAAMQGQSGGGHIINIASISSLVPAPGLSVYGATKAAVLQFTISLQGELDRARLPIKVSAVCPDAIETDMVRNVAGERDAALLFSSKNLLRPEAVADVVVGLVDNPRLVVTHPPLRAALAHMFRPFPALELRVLRRLGAQGEKNRRRRASGD